MPLTDSRPLTIIRGGLKGCLLGGSIRVDRQLTLDPSGLKEMLQGLREQRRVATEEQAQLLVRVSDLQRTITALDQAIAPLAILLGEKDANQDSAGGRTAPILAEVAERIMRQQDRRWRIAELIDRLKAIGHPLPEQETQQYTAIHSALKRRPQTFRRAARGQWVLLGSEADKTAQKDQNRDLFTEGEG